MEMNMPKNDMWELKDNDVNSQNYRKTFKFNFQNIQSESIKKVLKLFIWRNYREMNNTVRTLYAYVIHFKIFNEFAITNEINTLKKLSNNDVSMFKTFLKMKICKRSNKVYSVNFQRLVFSNLKTIIYWAQVYLPNEVPNIEIYTGNDYIGINSKLKIDFIPDEVLNQINEAIKNEENPYIKFGIIILQSTGIRIGDMMLLNRNCISEHLISGNMMAWYDHKNRIDRKPIAIPHICVFAVKALIEKTEELRAESNESIRGKIFISKLNNGNSKKHTKTGDIVVMSPRKYTELLKEFIKNNNIVDTNGELYELKSHQFRRTLATDMLSKEIDVKIIQEVMGHADPRTTKRNYADVKDKERAEVFRKIGIIGNINMVNNIITDKQELEWFNENKNAKARMCDGYCTKPFEDGQICDRLTKRQKCYTCSRYITTTEYLIEHKSHLKELENQIEENVYGEHYAEHFKPTIEILKEIINRLEAL